MKEKIRNSALVTGATGKIGQILVLELIKQNFKVRVLLRKGSISLSDSSISVRSSSTNYCNADQNCPHSLLSSDVEIAWGDITDYQTVLTAASGVDYIFHLAALLHINNPSTSLYRKYYDINVIGTKNVVDASLEVGVKRVVFFSTIAVYGPNSIDYLHLDKAVYPYSQIVSNQDIFSESSPVNPLTIYSKTKALAEKYQSPSVTILRLASVYGSRVTGNYLRLIEAVKRGFFVIPVNEKGVSVYRTLIHENDAVAGAILAATHPAAAGKIYNLTDGDIHSLEDIVKAIADALCVKLKILKIDGNPIRKVAALIRRYHTIDDSRLNLSIEKVLSVVDKLMENVVVDGHKIQLELGFKPQYSLQTGWNSSLAAKKNCLI